MSESRITVIGLKTCDTCRKALKTLRERDPGVEFRDIREQPLTETEISGFLATFGDALVNRRSTTWRGLGESERALPPNRLLAEHPTLMKRPVLVTPDGDYLGWSGDIAAKLASIPVVSP